MSEVRHRCEGRVWLDDVAISSEGADFTISVDGDYAEFSVAANLGDLADNVFVRVPYRALAMFCHDVHSRTAFRAGDTVRELGGYGQTFTVHDIEGGGETVVLKTDLGLTRIASKHLVKCDGVQR